jgi:hypothetical protein
MFARDFVHVNRPFEQVAPRFSGSVSWLDPIVDAALGGTRRAHCSRGSLRARESSLLVPLMLFFDPNPSVLTPLTADLTVAPLDAMQCVLTLEARLQPPAGIEATAVQHTVDSVLRAVLHGLVDVIGADQSAGAPGAGAPTS